MGGGTSPSSDSANVQVLPRYLHLQEAIEHIVMEVVREQLNRRQGTDNITRNFVKFLISACGLVEVRQLVVPKLEMWIMNPKVFKPAQELLMVTAMNCSTHSPADVEILGNFIKLRFKNKPNVNQFLAALRELCAAHKDNLATLLKHTIFNELSNRTKRNFIFFTKSNYAFLIQAN